MNGQRPGGDSNKAVETGKDRVVGNRHSAPAEAADEDTKDRLQRGNKAIDALRDVVRNERK
jgi:hypothetical protein